MREQLKRFFLKIPVVGNLARIMYRSVAARKPLPVTRIGSAGYWEQRYASGGNSGAGSYGRLAVFKADVLNAFVADRNIKTVIEFGCGDGNQLSLSRYPHYTGFDVSATAVEKCRSRYKGDDTKAFRLLGDYRQEQADLVLSLDVIFHLIEDAVFERHVRQLFNASQHYVIIYSSDSADNRGYEGSHVRHREITAWIRDNISGWRLMEHIPQRYPYVSDAEAESFADFFIYEKTLQS